MAIDQVLKMLIAHHNLVTYWLKPEIQQKKSTIKTVENPLNPKIFKM